MKAFKIYYNGSFIFVLNKNTYIVELDNSSHENLLSAKCWIDYLTK
jgi:hypothetical protein